MIHSGVVDVEEGFQCLLHQMLDGLRVPLRRPNPKSDLYPDWPCQTVEAESRREEALDPPMGF